MSKVGFLKKIKKIDQQWRRLINNLYWKEEVKEKEKHKFPVAGFKENIAKHSTDIKVGIMDKSILRNLTT